MDVNPNKLWKQCLLLIRENVTEQQFNTWFKPVCFESYAAASKTLLLRVPSAFVYEYLEENYGLQVNTRDFYVTYEAFASNLPPTIRVTAKAGA